MNNIQRKFLLFFCGCMVVRILIAIIVKKTNIDYLPYLGYIALLPVMGWFYTIFLKEKESEVGFFGGKVWWKEFRIIHLTLWSIFAYMAINKDINSWKVLLADASFSLIAFLTHNYNQGNFAYLKG